MALDYVNVSLSSIIIVLYIFSFFLFMYIRRKFDGKARTAFTFFIISMLLIIIRRLQQVFTNSQILYPMPYSVDIISLLLGLSLLLAAWYFHQAVQKASTERKFHNFRRESKHSEIREKKQPEKINSRIKDGYLDLTQ